MESCGISTACFYPTETTKAVELLGSIHQGNAEFFLNTFSELEPEYLYRLKEKAKQHHLSAVSVHPFTGCVEPLLFFSDYATRLQDGILLYRKFFEACKILQSPLLVFHGDTRYKRIDMKLYAQRFHLLATIAFEEYGIILAQENVERCCCGLPENICMLREYTNDKVQFVLDLKQARRAEVSPWEMIKAMGEENICHLHLSDYSPTCDCLPPGEGMFDFARLWKCLRANERNITSVIELYHNNFAHPQQLKQGAVTIDHIAKTISKEELHHEVPILQRGGIQSN